MNTAVLNAFEYLIGLAVFGLVYLFLDPLIQIFNSSIGDGGNVNQFAMFIWAGSLIIYLVLGSFYFLNQLKEWEIER